MKFFYSAAAIVSASKTLRPLDCIALRYFKAPTLRLSVIGDSEAVVLRTDPYSSSSHPRISLSRQNNSPAQSLNVTFLCRLGHEASR